MHVNYIFENEAYFSTPWKQMLIDLYPQVFKDGAIDLQTAQQLWDQEQDVFLDTSYGFTWPGKSEAQTKAFKSDQAMTLVLDEQESKNVDKTKNVYITGDNLSVLQTIYKSLHEQVACIFIDPPYNTTNHFIYNDDFTAKKNEILAMGNLLDEQGQALQQVSMEDRRHSNWLNMMYPRLQLARTLLKDDGHIFISIDDNEITNLRMICNEVFGESRLVCQATWVSNRKGRKQGSGVSGTKEYILCYRKQSPKDLQIDQKWAASIMPEIYTRPNYKTGEDDHGSYVLKNQLPNTNSKFNEETAPTMVFDIFYNPTRHEFRTLYSEDRHKHPIKTTTIINPYAEEGFIYIPLHPNAKATHQYHAWRWSREKIKNEPHNLVVKLQDNGRHQIWTTIRGKSSTHTGFKDIIMGPSLSTKQGSNDIAQLNRNDDTHPLSDMFQFPKPVALIQALIESCTDGDDLILDFFSGSGTTAHAVLASNARDGQNRRFMLVQLPEPTYVLKKGREVPTKSGKLAFAAGYRSIDAIARERIRRIEDTFDDATKSRLDCGFQAYHIAPSWSRSFDDDNNQANQSLPIEGSMDNRLPESGTDKHLMTECLLRLQEPVPHHITELSIDGHRVFRFQGSKIYLGVFDHILTQSFISTLRQTLPPTQRILHLISLNKLTPNNIKQMTGQNDGDMIHLHLV